MRKSLFLVLLSSVFFLSACKRSNYQKEVQANPDPGRPVIVENTELFKKSLGNTTIVYISDKATKTCVAQTERVGWWWGTPSVSISHMPPEACGFSPNQMEIKVVSLPPPSPRVLSTPVVKPKVDPPKAPTSCPVCKNPG